MSEIRGADDLGWVVKIIYRYALEPGGWVDLVDAMREIAPEPDGERKLASLDDHLRLAAELAVKGAPQVHETFASLELSSDLTVRALGPMAAQAFGPILGALNVGDQLDAGVSDAAAAIASGMDALKTNGAGKHPIVVPHGQKLSCSYLVHQPGTYDRYALYLMRNGFAAEYDLSSTVLSGLTDKEREICTALFDGYSPRQIAEKLGNSLNTVKYHLKSIFEKTGIKKQADLVRLLEQAYQLERELERQLGGGSQLIIDQPRHMTLRMNQHPPKQKLVRACGRAVAWREYGPADGKPLLWMHGAYGCGRLWPPIAAALEEGGLRAIAIDRPGYGGTSPVKEPQIDASTDDVLAVLNDLNIRQADVFATAMGTLYGLNMAHRNADRIARVFLCSSSFGPGGDWSKPKTRMQFAMWFAQRNPRAIHAMLRLFIRPRTHEGQKAQIRRVWSESPADAEALRDDRLVEHLIATGEEAVGAGIEGVVFDHIALQDAKVPLADIRQPVVEWHGLEDASISWEAAGKLLCPLPHLDRVPMPHRGQLLFHTDFHHIAERIAGST